MPSFFYMNEREHQSAKLHNERRMILYVILLGKGEISMEFLYDEKEIIFLLPLWLTLLITTVVNML